MILSWLTVGSVRAATIEFWHAWPHAEQSIGMLANQYTNRTGVKIKIRVFNPDSFNPWNSKRVPDLIGLYRPTKRGIEDLVRYKRAYDLRQDMGRGWYTAFWPGMLETFNVRGDGRTGVYGIPLTGQVHVFVYNKVLFRKAGISEPRTWSDLMLAAGRLRKAGVMPYAGGFGSDKPPLACAWEWSYMGLHRLAQTYFGRYSYTSPEWIRYLSLYTEMKRYGFTDTASAAMSGVDAIKAFLDGDVAIVFTDASFESIRATYKPRFTSWGVFAVPVDNRAQFLPRLPGGVVEGLVVSSRSSRKSDAIAFARWLTEPEQQIVLANGASAIPATPAAGSSTKLKAHLRTFASVGMRDQAIDMRVYENPRVLATFYSGVRSILSGSGTPLWAARKAQAARKRVGYR